MTTIGIADLSHRGSELVKKAEAGERFTVTRQGRDTGVVLARESGPASPPTAAASLLREVLSRGPALSDEQRRERLREIEAGRDQDVLE